MVLPWVTAPKACACDVKDLADGESTPSVLVLVIFVVEALEDRRLGPSGDAEVLVGNLMGRL